MLEPDQLPRTLSGYYERARAHLSVENNAYFLAGAGNEESLQDNEEAFAQARLIPRHLREVKGGSTATTILGQTFAAPIMVAPFAYHRALQPAGELATAQGAQAQAIKMVLSAQSSVEMSEVRAQSPDCDWFQLYWMGTRAATLSLAHMALEAGFRTLVLTIDAPVQGVRDREIESGFQLPADVSAVNLQGIETPRFAPLAEGESFIFDRIAHAVPVWDDIEWLIESVKAPVLLKGIMHPDDAAQAVTIGAAGIIVSNHGGRVLDKTPATLSILPSIVARVGAEYPVLMDGGIRRGVDVFVVLALGAKAVLLGRPIVCGLALAGELGVSHVLRLMRDELEIAMLLSGCARLSDITADMVHLKR